MTWRRWLSHCNIGVEARALLAINVKYFCLLRVFSLFPSPTAGAASFDHLDMWMDEFNIQASPRDPDAFPYVVIGQPAIL